MLLFRPSLLITAVVAGISATAALAQEAKNKFPEVQLYKFKFEQIQTIHLRVKVSNISEPRYIEAGLGSKDPAIFVFEYWRKGDSYRFDIKTQEEKAFNLQAIQAYDGERYQSWAPDKGGFLQVSSKKELRVLHPLYHNVLTRPFAFLTPNGQCPPEMFLGLDLPAICMEGTWTVFPGNVKKRETVFWGGNPYEYVKMYAGKYNSEEGGNLSEDIYYETYFSGKDQFYPVLSKKVDGKGRVFSELYVEKFVANELMPVPEVILVKHYGEKDFVDYVMHYKVEQIEINSKTFDDSVFTLDPSTSSLVHDLDTNSFIKVPK